MNLLTPKYNDESIRGRQTAKNIALQLKRAVKESKEAAAVLSKHFKAKSELLTCYNVWEYCKRNLKYNRESADLQTAKTIQRILADKKNNDCKHYTTFCCSILNGLGIKTQMRLISQNFYNSDPTHIYCVAYINNKEVIVDPCMRSFNSEASYKYKYNLNLN